MLKRILLAALFATATTTGATDYTDIWWNPAESGWGVNLAQNGNFIFATFFVYGTDNMPTWYTGQLALNTAGDFAGPLYATTGPWLGTIPFNPAQVGINQVGAATFHPTAADAGVLAYNVAAVQVAKNVQRQTLAPVPLAGSYLGGTTVAESGCSTAADNNTASAPANLSIKQDGSQVQVTLDLFGIFSCSFTGPATQTGQLLAFPAVYACSDGARTTARIYELRATSLGVEVRWTAADVGGGCREDGQFAGIRK